MKVEHYQEKDGDISFLVDSSVYPRLLAHLSAKGISSGGRESDTSLSEVIVSVTIGELNEALEDFIE